MTAVRFLIDDVNQSQTQLAVLHVFADDLQNQSLGHVVWASELPNLSKWDDVSTESSRRLELRLFALMPTASEQLTIFIPGHIIPSRLEKPTNIDHTIATTRFFTVSGLDLCVINNVSQETVQFQNFTQAHSDYESISNFNIFTSSKLPIWLTSSGLKSCLRLTDRPWYSVSAPNRIEWLAWVRRALEQDTLTIPMIKSDIDNGLVRPSLLDDVGLILNDQTLPSFPFTSSKLDTIFSPAECALSNGEYQLLHSKSLQARTLEFSKQRHNSILKDPRVIIKKFRSLFKKSIKLAHLTVYKIYTISFRPLVKKLFNRDNFR